MQAKQLCASIVNLVFEFGESGWEGAKIRTWDTYQSVRVPQSGTASPRFMRLPIVSRQALSGASCSSILACTIAADL